MLDIFRSRAVSNTVYGAVIIATIIAFVIGFRPNATSKTASLTEQCAARVHGRCIDPKDFASAYRILMPSRSQTRSRKLNMKKVALDGLIERELLVDEARRLGIGVTEAEVTDQLYAGFIRVSVPAADPPVAQSIEYEMFQAYARAGLMAQDVAQSHFNDRDTAIPVDFRDPKTKMFDMKTYERQVRNLSNRSTQEFREEQARELVAAKMRDVIRDPVRVSEPEAWQEYERRYSTATVSWIPVKESWAARWGVDVRQADVDAWVKEHQADFDKTFSDRKTDDEPKANHVRHILVKLPYGASDDEKAVGLAKLSWAAARIRAGEPFAEVARDVSEDTSSAMKGGDVGEKLDGFVPPFKAAAEALKPGETSPAIETQFGYHLITKDDPARATDVESAVRRATSRDLYAKSKATEVASKIAETIDDAMRGGKTADDAIAAATAPYVRDSKVEMLKLVAAPAEATDGGAPDASAKPDKSAKAAAPAKPTGERRWNAATDGERPSVQTSTAFNKGGDPFPGLSPAGTGSVMAFAFSGKDGDVLSSPVRTVDGFAVVTLKQHKTATRDEFAKDKETFVQQLLSAKRDETLSLYMKRLRERAKDDIKIDESYVAEAKTDGGAPSEGEDEEENE